MQFEVQPHNVRTMIPYVIPRSVLAIFIIIIVDIGYLNLLVLYIQFSNHKAWHICYIKYISAHIFKLHDRIYHIKFIYSIELFW